ncbi:MAG: DUF1934 family protein [Clostridia bacterium]|nr:DUF1934 family protein [Clostridia bacterium]
MNSYIDYVLVQDGVETKNSLMGNYLQAGNLNRVTFEIEVDGAKSEHSYVKLSNNSFKISVKGDSEYSITVKEGEESTATLKTGGISFPFTTFTKVCVADANDFGMNLYAEYTLTAFNQVIKNTLTLSVKTVGDIKC